MLLNQFDQPIGEPLTNFTGAQLPLATKLQGRFCALEKLDPQAHAAALFNVLCNPEQDANWTYLPYGPFRELDDFLQFIIASADSTDPLFYAILDLSTGQPVGIASLLRIEPLTGAIEIGHIHFSDKLQKTAHATEAMFLMMEKVFDTDGYRRYEWKCDQLNAPSKRAALRLGFSFEGVFRQATHYKQRNRDTAWFAVIDSEWPALRKAFQSWLASTNFDEQGCQIRRLETFREQP